MTAELVAFRKPAQGGDAEALLAAAVELHALVAIDPTLGASPVRVCFVFNPEAKARITACLDPADPGRARPAPAYALVAYDFPFALRLVEIAGRRIPRERVKAIVASSAGLQGDALRAAADALGVRARSAPAFDAGELKAAFFPDTQETVTHVFRLELQEP